MRLGLSWFLLLLPALPAAEETARLLRAGPALTAKELEPVVKQALRAPLVAIVDKAKPSPTGDPRDYVSYARYWWPDPTQPDGRPFVRRDGEHNQEQVAAGDRQKIDHLVDNVTVLALGWSRLQREACAHRAGEWLRAWFVTPATRMNPSLNYAQIRLGHNRNLGSPAGIIDTRTFAVLVQALELLKDSPALNVDEWKTVRQWWGEYFHWLETAPLAQAELKARNNHGSWFLVQAVAIALYLGNDDAARRLCEGNRARIAWQFAPDGSQPDEIARADSLHYSVFNLEAQLQLAARARAVGVELWHYTAPNGASLKRGVEFLRPYNAAPESWPHPVKEKLPAGFLDPLLQEAAALDRT